MGKLIDIRLAGMVFAVAAAFSTQACGEDGTPGIPGGDALLEECGLVCASEGVAEGNFAISGIRGVDAFFSSVVSFDTKASVIAGNINAELGRIQAAVGAESTAAADIKAAMVAKFKLDAQADIKVSYKPAECAVSAKATLEATAKCDANFSPGSAKVECKGSCKAEASAEVDCGASAEVKCVGTAPNLACEGECSGACELDAAASCSGTCRGQCSGTCSAEDAMGNCAGSCDGMCTGTCELAAAAECNGKCKGECTYTPPDGECEASAQVKCEAMGSASVECQGECDGEVVPPMASAECQASAKAEAELNVECTPPSIDISYQFDASLDAAAKAQAQAEFEAFLVTFRASFGAILAELKKADVVLKAGAEIAGSAEGAVTDAVEAIDVKASLKVSVGVGCALLELPKVAAVISGATTELEASVSAAAELTTSFGG
jgi:hypothetical protein